MLGNTTTITITRKDSTLDPITLDYSDWITYTDLEATFTEVQRQEFNHSTSQTTTKQRIIFYVTTDILNVEVWDYISFTNSLWKSRSCVIIEDPKMIQFEESDNYIKIISKYA